MGAVSNEPEPILEPGDDATIDDSSGPATPEPKRSSDRSRVAQLVATVVLPALVGALAGFLVGVSAPAYWVIALLAAVGAFIGGFEHPDGWAGADRGLVSGGIYGIALLDVHAALGAHAKVSLGSFPPTLALVTAVAGALLGAAGGRIGRTRRERAQGRSEPTPPAAPDATTG